MTDETKAPEMELDNETVVSSDITTKEGPMAELLKNAGKPPALDDVVEGPVVAVGRARVFIDLHPYGTGIIYGREYLSARETLKNVNIGDVVTAKVVGTDNAEGYVELSLREARQALMWSEAEVGTAEEDCLRTRDQRRQQGRTHHQLERHPRILAGIATRHSALSARR